MMLDDLLKDLRTVEKERRLPGSRLCGEAADAIEMLVDRCHMAEEKAAAAEK